MQNNNPKYNYFIRGWIGLKRKHNIKLNNVTQYFFLKEVFIGPRKIQ